MKERDYSLDLLRVVLSLYVIALHSLQYFGFENEIVSAIVHILLISSNGLYYMISGYFNLEKEFRNSDDIKKFYKNKFITILFPFLAFVFVWTIWDYVHAYGSFDIGSILLTYYRAITETSAYGHMWFMYPLFGLLLSTPFLSKMLHNMDKNELKILWRIGIGFNFVMYFLCRNFDIGFSVLCWILEGWTLLYFAGYYYRHVIVEESTLKWAILGICGYVITLLGNNGFLRFFKIFDGSTSAQPMFILYCIGCFLFWDKAIRIKDGIPAKIISFLGRNTYMIYLYHPRGIEYVVRKLSITGSNPGIGLLVTFGSYAISLLLAYVTNLLLKPVQKLLEKL